jgi:uncharacterized protein (TIGR02118 family)
MVKLIICAKRKQGLSHEEFSRYWRDEHGPLVKSVTEFSRHVRRYVQCHLARTEVPWGTGADYDGVAELWFDSAESAAAAFNEPKYMEIIRPDELKFADLERSISFMTEEKPVI